MKINEPSVGFDVVELGKAMMRAREKSRPCKKGDKRPECKGANRKERVIFPMFYPSRMGTPRTYDMGTADGGGANGANGGGDGGGMGEVNIYRARNRAKLFEYFSMQGSESHPNPNWGGYSIPNLGMIQMRGGGPVIGGPGFQHDGHGEGGVYNFKKSPGLGFRTEAAWRIWEKAMEIIDADKTMNKHHILLHAMAKANIHRGQVDPAELRLVEMGIEWYLTDPGSLAAKRSGGAMPPGSGGQTDTGGWLSRTRVV